MDEKTNYQEMMKGHVKLTVPRNSTLIWRYMDFAKFISLINNKSLFFPVAHIMEDKFEGSLKILAANTRRIYTFATLPKPFLGLKKEYDADEIRKNCAISCWHMNKGESAAMWSLYGQQHMAIAIQSSVGRLKSQIKTTDFDTVNLAKVIYYDGSISDEFFDPELLFYKRKSFEHEKEFRVVLTPESGTEFFDQLEVNKGLSIKVDLTNLIQNIYIAPFTPPWFEELVRSVVIKYELDIPVIRSEIDIDPSIG